MTANDCLKQMNDRYALFQTLWNMYFAVSFGLLAFLVSAKFHDNGWLWAAKTVAIVAYASFAYSNLGGLRRVRNEHDLFGALFMKFAKEENLADREIVDEVHGLARYRELPAEKLLVVTYLLGCVLVSVLILLIPISEAKP